MLSRQRSIAMRRYCAGFRQVEAVLGVLRTRAIRLNRHSDARPNDKGL
jgi:hypothetical protein